MKNIVLVGMMSSGKTTLGKKLARLLGYRFLDLDKMIELHEGMEISQIFVRKGEAYFREIESKLLKEVHANRRIVLATGGGTPCFFDNMDYIRTLGVSIFLDVPASDLAHRIQKHGKDDRPLLSGATSLEAELEARINQRRPYYTQAEITIEGSAEAAELLGAIRPLLQ